MESQIDLVRKNLEKYPTIRKLFTENWILKQVPSFKIIEDEIQGNSLIWMLLGDKERDSNELFLKLLELEENLKLLESEPGIFGIVEQAKSEEHFWPTISEIEVAAYFKRKDLLLKLHPVVGKNTPDLEVVLDGKNIYLEIYTPELGEQLKDALHSGNAVSLKNRAWDKINDKLKQMPKDKLNVLVINNSYSSFDSELVREAIMGTPAIRISKDQSIEPKEIIMDDGLRSTINLERLKAIVLYKRIFDIRNGKKVLVTDPTVHRLLNKNENLSDTQIEILKNVFQEMIYSK